MQENLALRIIDRKKNIFKLSQGEYIAPEKLEQCYLKSYLIGQIFVYGDSLHNNLVAIIIPDKQQVELADQFKDAAAKDYNKLIESEEFENAIFDEMKKIKGEYNLNSLEVPKAIKCTDEELTPENGCLTPTMKLVRNIAKDKFLEDIRALYGGGALQGEEE